MKYPAKILEVIRNAALYLPSSDQRGEALDLLLDLHKPAVTIAGLTMTVEVYERVIFLIKDAQYVETIKFLRLTHRLTLKEAKEAMDLIKAQIRREEEQ